jgi:hypothetical protein
MRSVKKLVDGTKVINTLVFIINIEKLVILLKQRKNAFRSLIEGKPAILVSGYRREGVKILVGADLICAPFTRG